MNRESWLDRFCKSVYPVQYFSSNNCRLNGLGAEVAVGPDAVSSGSVNAIWCLPRDLISHHSIVLKNMCQLKQDEARLINIPLPNEDPTIFDLFVQWMHCGRYTFPFPWDATYQGINLDILAWILGDTLQATEFKNYAMCRLHAQYGPVSRARAMTTADFKHVCLHCKPGTKLRELFFDVLVVSFSDGSRLKGDSNEWDKLLLEHADARHFLLQGLISKTKNMVRIPALTTYQDKVASQLSAVRPPEPSAPSSVPSKRTADGEPVKKEAADS